MSLRGLGGVSPQQKRPTQTSTQSGSCPTSPAPTKSGHGNALGQLRDSVDFKGKQLGLNRDAESFPGSKGLAKGKTQTQGTAEDCSAPTAPHPSPAPSTQGAHPSAPVRPQDSRPSKGSGKPTQSSGDCGEDDTVTSPSPQGSHGVGRGREKTKTDDRDETSGSGRPDKTTHGRSDSVRGQGRGKAGGREDCDTEPPSGSGHSGSGASSGTTRGQGKSRNPFSANG